MRMSKYWILLVALMMCPVSGYQGPSCDAPVLSDQQVKDVIDKERSVRKDLPTPFPQYRWIVRREGCYYVYIEYALPETPDMNHIIKLNKDGVIVDADTEKLKCPDKVYTESELAEIVKSEREKRQDLPPALAHYKTRVSRLRCSYLYFEYAVPEKKGDFQLFTIDQFGKVMDFTRSKPY